MDKKKIIIPGLIMFLTAGACVFTIVQNVKTTNYTTKAANGNYVISLNSGATKYRTGDTYIRGANPGILIKMNQNALEEVADSAWAQIASKGGYFEIASGKQEGSDIYGSIHGLTNLQLEFNNIGNSFTVYYGHDLNEEQTSIKKII